MVNTVKLEAGKRYQKTLEAVMDALTNAVKEIPQEFSEETQLMIFLSLADIGTLTSSILEGLASAISTVEHMEVPATIN